MFGILKDWEGLSGVRNDGHIKNQYLIYTITTKLIIITSLISVAVKCRWIAMKLGETFCEVWEAYEG